MEKTKIISNLFWKLSERMGAQIVSLIVSMILARIIGPEEYGIIALMTVFITISNVFIESGMGSALIQKKDADDLDFSSVFYFNIIMSILLYFVLFSIAPLVAKFYNNKIITTVLRVLGITIIISALKNVQNAYVSKNMIFKKFFICNIISIIISAIVGITMAYNSFGVWALVAQQLTNNTIGTIILWFLVNWKPKLTFSIKRLKKLINYGWKLLTSSLIDTLYNNLNSLVIGKVYNSEELAYYNKANQIPYLLVINVNNSISSVMFPYLSIEQDDKKRIKAIMKKSIKMSSYVMVPILFGLAAVAGPLIEIILTNKWSESVIYMQILSIAYLFYPIHVNNLEALKAIGKSDLYLKLEILKKIVGILLLIISVPFGVLAMVISIMVNSIISTVINTLFSKKIFNYGFLEQIKDVLPTFLIGIFMFLIVYMISYIEINTYLLLLIQILVGCIIYLLLSLICKIDTLKEIKFITKNIIKRKIK